MTVKKLSGYLLLVVFMAVYAVVAVTIGDALLGGSVLLMLIYYAVVGIGIVYPCIKILDWTQK